MNFRHAPWIVKERISHLPTIAWMFVLDVCMKRRRNCLDAIHVNITLLLGISLFDHVEIILGAVPLLQMLAFPTCHHVWLTLDEKRFVDFETFLSVRGQRTSNLIMDDPYSISHDSKTTNHISFFQLEQ